MLEVRLGASRQLPVDFSTRLSQPTQGMALASRFAQAHDLLVGGWVRLGHPQPIPHLWLELDDSAFEGSQRYHEPLPTPLVITHFAPGTSADWLISSWLGDLFGRGQGIGSPSLVAPLKRCLADLDAPGRVLYGFDLRARGGGPPLRLEIVGLSPVAMAEYLARIAGDRLARPLRELVDWLGPIERPHLSFELDAEGVGPRVGLEASFRRQPDREPGWRRILDWLVAAGLCHPDQARALLVWPGSDHLRSALDRWPTGARGHLVRALSHVKLVLEPDREPAAKAYLLTASPSSRQ